jgi:hypothetical protein
MISDGTGRWALAILRWNVENRENLSVPMQKPLRWRQPTVRYRQTLCVGVACALRLRPWRYEVEVGDSAKRRLSDRFDRNI